MAQRQPSDPSTEDEPRAARAHAHAEIDTMRPRPPPSPRRRARRVLGTAAALLASAATFVGVAGASLVLHLDSGPARRLAAAQLNTLLGDTFQGKIVLEHIDRLDLGGVGGVRARIYDPEGVQVLFVDGVSAHISAIDAARSAVLGENDMVITVRRVEVDYVDANLDADDRGDLRIARAFESKTPEAPSDPDARPLHFEIERADIRHGWVHGTMAGAPPLDVDLDALHGRVDVTDPRVLIELASVDLTARNLPEGLRAGGNANGSLTIPTEGELALVAGYRGHVSDIPLVAKAEMEGDALKARLEIAEVEGDVVRAAIAAAPIHDKVSGVVTAEGTLPELAVTGDLRLGPGTAKLEAKLRLPDDKQKETRIDAKLVARQIDPRTFAPDAPATRASADVTAAMISGEDGKPRGTFHVATQATTLQGERIPALDVRGELTGDELRADARAFEPGIDLRAHVEAKLAADARGSQPVDFELTASAARLKGATRLGGMLGGSAKVRAKGRADVGLSTVQAEVHASGADITAGPAGAPDARLTAVEVEGTAAGSLQDPRIDVRVRASGVNAAGYTFTSASVHAQGSARAPELRVRATGPDIPHLEVTTSLDTQNGVSASDVRLELTRNGVPVVLSAKRAGQRGNVIVVEKGVLEGLGEPVHADLSIGPASMRVEARSNGVDVATAARFAGEGLDQQLRGGKLTFLVDLSTRGDDVRGDVQLHLADGRLAQVKKVEAQVSARLMGTRLAANVHAAAGDAGHLHLATSTIELGGPAMRPASWRTARGELDLDVDVDLGRVAGILPRDTLPFGEMSGRLTVDGQLGRATAEELPAMDLDVKTEHLVLAGKSAVVPTEVRAVEKPAPGTQRAASQANTEPATATGDRRKKPAPPSVGTGTARRRARASRTPVVEPPPWRLTGIDVDVNAKLEAQTGKAALAGKVLDSKGTLLSLDAESTLPMAAILGGDAVPALEKAPFEMKLEVPRRDMATLPSVLEARQTKGTIALRLEASGTALEPKVEATLEAREVMDERLGLRVPTSTLTKVDYRDGKGKLDVAVSTPAGEVLTGTADAEVRVRDLVHPPPGELPWSASASADLKAFPLSTVGALADSDVDGTISGSLRVEDLRRDAHADVRLGIDKLVVGKVPYTGGFVNAHLGNDGLRAEAQLRQKDGWVDVRAAMGARWGKDLVPSLEQDKPAEITLKAADFRLAAVQPFVEDVFSSLDGRLDADARVSVRPGAAPVMAGTVELDQGRFRLPTVGDEFTNAKAKVVVRQGGEIRLEHFSASGLTGKVAASAAARMNGLRFVGGTVRVEVPEKYPLPLTIEGESMGQVSGKIEAKATMSADQKHLAINVDIPRLRTELPQTSARSVQKLDEAEYVRIGNYRRHPRQFVVVPLGPPEPEEAPRAGDAMKVDVNVYLRDVEIRQGTTLRAHLKGAPKIQIGEATQVRGQIQLLSGYLEVQGKRFEIEKGTVTFVGDDPANPEVVVTASYEAPDGTMIYADFVGPLETGKVTLRSEPALPQSEILAIIVFGTADGANSTPPPGQEPDGTTRAVGMGGGFATQGLNAAMSDMTSLDVTARVDTSDSNNPRPELEVQISREVSVAIAHVLGIPPPGSNPDKNLLSVNWRFARNWSFETTVGDRGSSIFDLIWRRRY